MQREVIGILGKTGYGKSVWLRRFIKPVKRLFMFDPLQDADVTYVELQDLLEMHDEGIFREGKQFKIGIFYPHFLPTMGALSFVSADNVLAIEECAIAFENPRASIESWLNELIFLGRHRRVTMVFIAQRAISIPISVRSQFTRLVTFAQHEGADIGWLREYFGNRVFEIPALKPLECLDSYKGEVSKYMIPYDHPRQKPLESGTEIEEKDSGLFDDGILVEDV